MLRSSYLYIHGYPFSVLPALCFLVVEASILTTFISFTTTLESTIRLVYSDKWIDQPNVTYLMQIWIMQLYQIK